MAPEISLATDSTKDRSASPRSVVGVPTATKMAALERTASCRLSENCKRWPRCRLSNSGRNFSWMGTCPFLRAVNFCSSLSTTMTSWPRSAKQAPATKPTYPEPTIAIRMLETPWMKDRGTVLICFVGRRFHGQPRGGIQNYAWGIFQPPQDGVILAVHQRDGEWLKVSMRG